MDFLFQIGYLLICNLIVGTGALALPKAFQSAGYVLSIVLLLVSAFTSYVSATFIIEAMGIANANEHRVMLRKEKSKNRVELESAFEITKRVEVASKYGVMFLSFIMTIYLFGDLAIYSTTVPNDSVKTNEARNTNPCYGTWPHWLNRIAVYRLSVVAFTLFVTPLVVIGVTRTKYMQVTTSACRWTAFTIMIILACMRFGKHGVNLSKAADMSGFGSLFGTTVYAFMCHHSLPSLVTPMKSKKGLCLWLILVYGVIFLFYLLLSLTGILAFKEVFDVYPLNFLHGENKGVGYQIINYFLALFPVFTLTSNYPIVANTLINNFTVLLDTVYELWFHKAKLPWSGRASVHPLEVQPKIDLTKSSDSDSDSVTVPHRNVVRYVVMAVIILVATTIALCTDNVLILSTVTGSYPGVGVQYIIPALLVIYGRKHSRDQLTTAVPGNVRSPFKQNLWPYIMFGWSLISIVMTTLNLCKVFDKI
uniref:Aa_trans domain-containing protein n=1 Tax=Syphacia muris TaxID=451379 RepID=A0A0N5AQ51_9BILA